MIKPEYTEGYQDGYEAAELKLKAENKALQEKLHWATETNKAYDKVKAKLQAENKALAALLEKGEV